MKNTAFALLIGGGLFASEAAEMPRAILGVQVAPHFTPPEGVVVKAVKPFSPAAEVSLQEGDVLLRMDEIPLSSSEDMRAYLNTLPPGKEVTIDLMRRDKTPQQIRVRLADRAQYRRKWMDSAVHAFPGSTPLAVPADIRSAMVRLRRDILKQFMALPGDFEPDSVTKSLQAIRHHARDANPRGEGWMPGEAGEVVLRFRDKEGGLELYGANGNLLLTVYDSVGKKVYDSLPLNTAEQRARIPQPVIDRLKKLR